MTTCDIQALLDQAGCFSCLEPQQQAAIRLQLLCEILNNGGGGGGGVPPTRLINTTAPLTGGGDLSANRTIGIPQATALVDGYLAAADWTTFNGKVGGSGTVNKLAKFTAGTALGDSIITDDGTDATVAGRLRFSGTTNGGLVLNNLTTVQRDAIAAPLAGSLIWNTTTGRANIRTASAWTSGWVRLEGDTMTGALGITQGAITADAAALSITSTYNNAAVTFGGALRIDVTDTASNAASLIADFRVNGVSQLAINKGGRITYSNGNYIINNAVDRFDFFLNNGNAARLSCGSMGIQTGNVLGIGWSSTTNSSGAQDLALFRDAADTLAQRRTTNAQTFRLYNTVTGTDYTATGNYERGFVGWVSNVFTIGTEKGSGGGSSRNLLIQRDGVNQVTFSSNGADFAVNIRPTSAGRIQWTTRTQVACPSNGSLVITRETGDDGLLFFQLGGGAAAVASASYPAIYRRTGVVGIEWRAGDDSAFASAQSLYQRAGAGSPEGVVTAPVGTIYSRTDGGAGTSLYVKESGTGNTGWVAK